MADAEFELLHQGLSMQAVSVSEACVRIARILTECYKVACRRKPKAAVTTNGAPWFDEECKAPRDAFRAAWEAYTQLRREQPEHDLQQHPVYIQAHAARAAWARMKRWKSRAHARRTQQAFLDQFFQGNQQHLWRDLKGTRHAPCPLPDVAAWTEYFKALYGCRPCPLTLSQEQQAIKSTLYQHGCCDGSGFAEELHAPVHTSEVVDALHQLRHGKGHDAHGLTAELLRLVVQGVGQDEVSPSGAVTVADIPVNVVVCPHLLECLVYIFNNLPDRFPPELAMGKLVPVPKAGGSATDMGSYRGICVSPVLSQVHDGILHQRMEQYIDGNGMRAVVQCGFRRGHGTLDALFCMQHIVSKQVHAKAPLYVCYVDFAKAFDMVRREEVLQRAQQLGMAGPFLDALAKWFHNNTLSVAVNGRVGESFPTYRGTKQGSKLSPLCFGLFIEQLHELIKLQLPGAGPVVGNMRVPDIMYADDVKLLACAATELQQLLDCLWLFCQLFDMQVNVSPHKTCILLYGTAARLQATELFEWKLGDQVVPVCESYKDLGMRCLAAGARKRGAVARELSTGVQVLSQAGRRAMHAVMSMCRRKHLTQPDIRMRLFDSLVEPVLSYACQVWGPWLFHGRLDKPLKTACEQVHLDFIRCMSGVGKQCKQELMLHDFGRSPIMWHWVKLAIRFWNKMADNPFSLAGNALRADVQLMLSGCTDCWSFKLLDTLTSLGILQPESWKPGVAHAAQLDTIMELKLVEDDVAEHLQQRWQHVLSSAQQAAYDPRSDQCTSDHVMAATYVSWVRAANLQLKPPFLKATDLSFRQVQCISRVRLGWMDLAVHTGRFLKVPRHQRICKLCEAVGYHGENGHAAVEDLLHYLVECPIMQPIRDKFPALFQPQVLHASGADVHARFILNHKDQLQVVSALGCLRAHRRACLVLCEEGKVDEVLPINFVPLDIALQRLMAEENYYAMPAHDRVLLWY
jgi:hypothetical protein